MTLKELADELQYIPNEAIAYYDKVKNELVIALDYEDDYFPLIDDMEEKDEMIALPDSFEINDRKMMLRFAQYNSSDELLSTLHGKGLYRRFKEKVSELGLDEEWYKFKDEWYLDVVENWCNRNGLKLDDCNNVLL